MAREQYGLEARDLRHLPSFQGPKAYGLIYLRNEVEKLSSLES